LSKNSDEFRSASIPQPIRYNQRHILQPTIAMTETANPAIQAVIEAIEALSIDERESLFDILRQRRIEARRQEIAQNGEKTMEAVRNGTAKRGTPEEIMAYLLAEVDS
jgi:hypothetical protein